MRRYRCRELLVSCRGVCAVWLFMAIAMPVFAAHDHAMQHSDAQKNAAALAISASFDAHGRVWLARVIDQHVVVSHSDDLGKTFSMPVQVNAVPEKINLGGEYRPKLVAAGGRIYVSWNQGLPQRYSGNIRFAVSTNQGKSFTTPLTVNADSDPDSYSHRFDALSADENGNVAIAWIDKRAAVAAQRAGEKYHGAAIYIAESHDGGISFGSNRKLADHSCECCRLAIARDPDGTPVVMWRQLFESNIRDFALARVGEPLQRVATDGWAIDACPHHGGAMAIDKNGQRHLIWFTGVASAPGLFYRRMNAGKLTSPYAVGDPQRQAGHPAVLAEGQRVFVAWKEFDGNTTTIRVMLSSDHGANWNKPATLASTRDAADYPLLIAGRGHAWLVWHTTEHGLQFIDLGSL